MNVTTQSLPTRNGPINEHHATKARLREYEEAYAAEHGHKPRRAEHWGEAWQDYERYAVLRHELERRRVQQGVAPPPVPASTVPAAATVAVATTAAEAIVAGGSEDNFPAAPEPAAPASARMVRLPRGVPGQCCVSELRAARGDRPSG